MAYYNHCYHDGLSDYYSQNLFSFSTSATSSFSDPYAYTPTYDPHYDHDDARQRQHQHRSRPVPATTTRPGGFNPHSSPPFVTPPSAPDLHRARSPPPPPEVTPSESYLAFSCVPSMTLSAPTRKLLVLDLNGTLLLRSPRPPRSSRGQHLHLGPAPRRVMPRPYLAALRAYFFAPSTRAWLDIMVWSSAQPHSVDDMVLHAFGNDRAELVAVWARDTLGLAENLYHRKVQTIKDLEKPWAALASPEQGRASPSSIASSRDASPEVSSRPASPEVTRSSHSAATTILLDDSHAKAALQPHNHLCVREYTRAQRNADLTALAPRLHRPQHAPPPALETTAPDGEEASVPAHHPGKKHKRKRGKEQEHDLHPEQQGKQQRGEEGEGLDETLLAVIGILHAARLQSSIAGWLRAGALLQPRPPPRLEQGAEWFDDPALMLEWARRGREAMHELGLAIEHGVEP